MNYGRLLKYELKKVLAQKAYWLALIVMIVMLIANETIPIYTGNYETKMSRMKAMSGTVIDDEIIDTIREVDDPHEYDPIYEFLKFATGSTDLTGVTAESLYKTRDLVNVALMEEDGATAEEVKYWQELDKSNVVPFTYTYDGFYEAFFDAVYFMNFMVLILCGIGLSGLFADEKGRGTDQIIFGTRNGRKKLFYVKLTVGVIVGAFSSLVLIAEEIIACAVLYGTEGADTMIQLHIPQCMMNITMGQAVHYMCLLELAVGIFLGLVAMFLSQLTMNHAASMASMIFLLFASMINIPGGLRIIKLLSNLMPGAFVGSWLFYNYITVDLFGIRLNIMQYAPMAWLLIGIVLMAIAFRSYARYEVKAR
ncbi:MAG: hypothetical protein IJ757_06340 [Clostridiales bacterium]|nr:hypothetical protein [Clostridiales bacterium]